MATAFDLYHKLDHEGNAGLTWFKDEDFDDDPELQRLFGDAFSSYIDLEDDVAALYNYIESKVNNDEVSNPDS